MAPELAEGARAAGAPADVFAFALIACELLTGESAFDVPPVLVARKLPAPRALPSSVPASISATLMECLRADPAARPTARVVDDVLASASRSRRTGAWP